MDATSTRQIHVSEHDHGADPTDLGHGTTEHVVTTASGRRVVVWRTVPLGAGPQHPHPVVVAPGFARPMTDMAGVALGLAANGLTAYRFDPLDHVGLSDGTIREFTMTAGAESVAAVADLARAQTGADPSYLASSLSARYVLRHVSGRREVHGVVLVVGVVHAWRTLRLVFGDDFCRGGLASLPPLVSFDGQDIDPLHLWRDDQEGDWGSASGAVVDLAGTIAPVTGIYATDDPWVDIADVRTAFAAADHLRLLELPTDDHELFGNPVHGQTAITTAAAALIGGRATATSLLRVPVPVIRQVLQLERSAVEARQPERAIAGSAR